MKDDPLILLLRLELVSVKSKQLIGSIHTTPALIVFDQARFLDFDVLFFLSYLRYDPTAFPLCFWAPW